MKQPEFYSIIDCRISDFIGDCHELILICVVACGRPLYLYGFVFLFAKRSLKIRFVRQPEFYTMVDGRISDFIDHCHKLILICVVACGRSLYLHRFVIFFAKRSLQIRVVKQPELIA